MAFSAHTDPDVLRETCSEYDVIDKQAAELAHLIHDSKHFIVFTGAGISTSAGIPDFRGPNGIWTREAQGVPPTADDDWDLEKCSPTKTHMALVKLETEGLLCYIVSQNCDGLHYRSGIPSDKLSELHGNMYLEYCKSCEKQYLRDYDCQSDEDDHKTGRKCTCRNPLYDSLIHFGEDLPEKTIGKAFQMAEQCDLCLVLGSSLTVTPAADIPKLAGERSKLVICNLQKTPLDAKASLRIFGKSDLFMERVMRHLNLPVPVWKLERRIEINATVAKPSSKGMQKFTIEVVGLAPHEGPASFLSQCEFQVVKASAAKCKSQGRKIKREPFVFSTFTKQTKEKDSTHNIQIIFGFMGHFNEPKYTFNFTMENNSSTYTKTIELDLDPQTGQWNCT